MVNIIVRQKREHSRKPDEVYDVIEKCSGAPYLEFFARHLEQIERSRSERILLDDRITFWVVAGKINKIKHCPKIIRNY
jgi:N6-adenosine-specific RNA methylase IME4